MQGNDASGFQRTLASHMLLLRSRPLLKVSETKAELEQESAEE